MDDVWNAIRGVKRGKSDANGRLLHAKPYKHTNKQKSKNVAYIYILPIGLWRIRPPVKSGVRMHTVITSRLLLTVCTHGTLKVTRWQHLTASHCYC